MKKYFLFFILIGLCSNGMGECGSLADAITNFNGSGSYSIRGTENLTSNITIPSGFSLKIFPGGSINGAYTLTGNDLFEGTESCFGTNLTVVSLKRARPEWWAQNTTPGTTDMTDACNDAVNSVAATGGIVELEPGQTYYIGGGSNSTYAEAGDNYNDGIRLRSNVILEGNNCLLTSDQGSSLASDQFRIITNYCGDLTSKNITIKNVRLKHTGTAGYYTNGIWINGGETTRAEHWANNFTLENIYCEDLRVGIVIRDNMPQAAPRATNTLRRTYNIRMSDIQGIDCTSALISPDGDDIFIRNVGHDASGAASSYDTIAMHRGHRVFINNVRSYGLISGYGIHIRNSMGADTTDIKISNVMIDGGKGMRIGTETVSSDSEFVERISCNNIDVLNGAFLVDKSLEAITVRDIKLSNIFVYGGTTLDSLAGIGFRVFTLNSFPGPVKDVEINNLQVRDTSGIGVVLQCTDSVKITNFSVSRADTTESLIKLSGNNANLSITHGTLNTGDAGIDIFGVSATITGYISDVFIANTNKAVDWDGIGSANLSIKMSNIFTDDVITFMPSGDSAWKLLPGITVTDVLSGAITASHNMHSASGEGDAADNLDTINGNYLGQKIILKSTDPTNELITVRHLGGGTGNVRITGGGDIVLSANVYLTLIFDGNNWVQGL